MRKNGRLKQKGVGLIEILISMLIVSIGMLGVGAILITTLKNNQGSVEHSQAVIKSYAMLDAMRANKPSAIIGHYNLTSWTCNPPASDSRIGKELADWIVSLQNEVSPSACGRIECSSLSCNVSVRWDDDRASGGEEGKSYTLMSRI